MTKGLCHKKKNVFKFCFSCCGFEKCEKSLMSHQENYKIENNLINAAALGYKKITIQQTSYIVYVI